MKLFYWNEPGGNFGDDLNPWLWSRLIPELLADDNDHSLIVGIGTLLTSSLPKTSRKIVLGSGAWHGKPLPIIDSTFDIRCVRGPLTAEILQLDAALAIADPAILVRTLVSHEPEKNAEFGYMPHHRSTNWGDWRSAAEQAGIKYVDPTGGVEETLNSILSCDILIAEAMHGAIIADAFRVPWIPVKAYSHVLEFKWNDWCESIKVKYQPTSLPSLWNIPPATKRFGTLYKTIKSKYVAHKMQAIAKGVEPCLSSESILDDATCRLMNVVTKLKTEHSN